MKTFYTILLAILLPNLALSHVLENGPSEKHKRINFDELIDGNTTFLSLPQIICPSDIDSILPSRRDCDAVIDYMIDFDQTNCPISQFNLSQNFSDNNITAFSCSNNAETSHLRVYDLTQSGLPSQIFLTGIDVGVGFSSSEPTITLNIYRLNGPFIYANMTLLESYQAVVPIISSGIFTVPSNVLVNNTDMIVVELVAPSFEIAQIPGYNVGGGQSAPSYIASPACNIMEPVDLATFGQPDFNLVLKLKASNFSLQQTAGIESGKAFPPGKTVNTFELSDPAGNSTSCSFDVNVIFGEAPFLICPTNIDAESEADFCGATVDFDVFILETCLGDTIFQIEGIPSGGEFPPGFTRNVFVAEDMFGGLDTCRFDVFVADITAPTFECIDDISIEAEDNECGAVVDFEILVNDFCGIDKVIQIAGLPSGFVFPVGVTTNRYIATDAAGNSTECSFNIIIEDGSEITFVNCPVDMTVSTETEDCGAIVNYELPVVAGGECDSLPVKTRQNFSNTVVSSYGCNKSIESRHLRVFDMPKMGINGDFLVEFMEMGIGFTDTDDPQIDLNIYNIESDEILYENMTLVFSKQYLLPTLADATHTVTVNHLVPRGQKVVIELVVPEDNTTRFITGYSDQGEFRDSYFAAPACGYDEPVKLSSIGVDLALVMELEGSVTNNRLVSQTAGLGRGEFFPIGETINTFSLDDGSTCSFKISVVDGSPPIIDCPADVTMSILGNSCDTMVIVDLPIVLDNCGSASVTNDYNMMESASDIYNNGITPVTFTTIDPAGNTNSCVMNVTVNGALGVNVETSDVSCTGENDGEIVVEILSGEPPYSFTWSNGQITPTLTNLAADTYSLTVQDESQCTFEVTVVIFEPTPLSLENVLINNSINDQDNGNINLDMTGGTPPYNYNWSNNEDEANITNLAPGMYNCTVTDSLGCTIELGPYEIEGVVSVSTIGEKIAVKIYPNPTIDLLSIEIDNTKNTSVQYEVFNTIGTSVQRGVFKDQATLYQLNVKDFAAGIYFLRLTSGSGQSSTPFVVQRP